MVLTVTIESKNCTKKVLISHEVYDKFNHLNTVNSFHKLIEERLQKYKGVASKYINRYNALFIMQRETQGMDNTEKLQYVLSIPWWRSHPIHENRATESIWTEPCNPLLRATKSTKRATSP